MLVASLVIIIHHKLPCEFPGTLICFPQSNKSQFSLNLFQFIYAYQVLNVQNIESMAQTELSAV